MFVGSQTFDPGQIVIRILVLQAAFYVSLVIILSLLVAPYSRAGLTVDHIFNHNALQLNSFTDAMIVVAFIVNSVAMAVALRYIVARAKKCLDYGATIYCLHLAACWALRALPTNPVWWAVIAACAAVTVLLGELLCVRFEMMDIPIGGMGRRAKAPATVKPSVELV